MNWNLFVTELVSGITHGSVYALIALGYKPPEVTRLLRSADEPGLSTTEIIRRALKSAVRP